MSETFISIVEQQVSGPEDAEQATRATLQVLGERIDREQARQLAAELPPEVAPWLATDGPAQRFDADEFVRRVADREGADLATAREHARAVLDALRRTVSRKEWDDVVAELPSGFAPLLPEGPDIEVWSAEAFLQRVAEEAGLAADRARRATDAVLETLAERIAGGEVDDLVVRLPIELHPPLARGRDATGGRATPLSAERFVERVAERERAGAPAAATHTRAVLHVLREAVGDEEFRDVTSELPEEFVRTLVRSAAPRA